MYVLLGRSLDECLIISNLEDLCTGRILFSGKKDLKKFNNEKKKNSIVHNLS